MRKSEVLFALSRIISDAVMIFAGLMLAYFFRMSWFGVFGLSAPTTLIPLSLFINFAVKISLFLLLVMSVNGRYRFDADEKTWNELRNVFWAFSTGFALVIVIFFFAKFHFFSRLIFGMAWLAGLIFILGGRTGLRWIRKKFWARGLGRVRILLLGTGTLAREAAKFLRDNPKFEVLGILKESDAGKSTTFERSKILGSFADFEKILKDLTPDEVLLAADSSFEKTTDRLARLAHTHHVRFRLLPDEVALDLAAVDVSTLGKYPLLTLRATKLDGWGLVIKTTFDMTIAAVALLVLSPLLVFIGIKIWRENTSAPIFYRSKRVGKNGKEFWCFKFRSMVPDAEVLKKKLMKKNERRGGILFKMKNDPRVTKLGQLLRKWSLDEIPQLFNILRGEMSLIGPRPHLIDEVKHYLPEHRVLLSIKPGLTGFAQINGRSDLSFEEEMKYELFYLKNWSSWLDVIIFVKSIGIVLGRKNVS